MFQNNRVNLVYRVVCLLTFIAVIIHTKSFITLAILSLAFYLFTKDNYGYIIGICHTITIVVFLISYTTSNYFPLRIILILDLAYYFISMTNTKPIISDSADNYISSKYLIRFANNKRKDLRNNNMLNTMYVTIHLVILFISILVG